MLTPDQINEIHRLHWIEKWPQRRIVRHLHIGRHTLAKYLDQPAAALRVGRSELYEAADGRPHRDYDQR